MMYPELFPESARYCYVRTDSSYTDLANFEELAAEEKSLVSQAVDVGGARTEPCRNWGPARRRRFCAASGACRCGPRVL